MIYIFNYNGNVKAYTSSELQRLGSYEGLRKLGWNHVATIDPCQFIESLAKKSSSEILNTINNFKKK